MIDKKLLVIAGSIAGIFCFVLVCGCGGLFLLLKRDSTESSDSDQVQVAIRYVLDMDDELGQGVGGETPSEIAAAIDSYITQAQAIDMQLCPPDFRVAYRRHLHAWAAAGSAIDELPDGIVDAVFLGALNSWTRAEMDGGQSRLEGKMAAAEAGIRDTWYAVEDVALKYGVAK